MMAVSLGGRAAAMSPLAGIPMISGGRLA